MVIGWFILLPLIAYCKHKGLKKLPQWAFTWDNEEDGYDGLKGRFWKWYLGTKGKTPNLWTAYWWCAFRNPCWNLRYHKWASISVKIADVSIEHTGNTNHHDYVKGYQWYDTVINGKYKSHFRLIPVTSDKSLYLRWGWKIYPSYYVSGLKEVPKYKDRSVWALSIRLRGPE